MITVKRITGESYDLETGEEIPKTLVLSNGSQEVSIAVDDETAVEVVKLMVGRQEPMRPEEPQRGDQELSQLISEEMVKDLERGDGSEMGEWDDPESGVASI
jgi:hypothetical protein